MLGIFIGISTLAFFLAFLAKDKRGMTYGLYAGLACMLVCGLILFRNSLTLVPLVGFMGGPGWVQWRWAGHDVWSWAQAKSKRRRFIKDTINFVSI